MLTAFLERDGLQQTHLPLQRTNAIALCVGSVVRTPGSELKSCRTLRIDF